MEKLIIFIFLCSLQLNCYSQKNTIPIVDLQNPKKTKIVRLSEMISNLSLVRLETSKDILIGKKAKYLVGEKFLITVGEDKILLFSNTGKYIKTIAVTGRGPNEYENVVACGLDDKNGILYINQRDFPGTILAYNLNKNEPVRKIQTGITHLLYYIVVQSDNVLAISPGWNEECNFLFISTSGKILKKVYPSKGIGIGIAISKVGDIFYYKPKQIDTLYIMENLNKVTYCFIKAENRATLANHEIANFVLLSNIGSNFMIVKKLRVNNIELSPNIEALKFKADESTLYWVDKKDFSVSEITGFYNDYFGINEAFNPFMNFLSVCNDFGYISYSSFQLKQWLTKTLESPDLDNSVKLKISKFNEGLDENDNPVLIFGKLK
jgi:hypothetical protein